MWRSEPRISLAVVAAAAAVFVLVLLVVPPFGVTFDEAKYLGIGYSMVEGHGPQIVFGGYFLPHAPVWPTVVVAPAVALGIDPLIVGRTLNALSGLALILLAAAFAWRIRPAAAALAAVGLLATVYLHELTRTARLDVPAAALAVAYLAVGLLAVRRGSARLGIVAGLTFALAFLIKEIVLPLGPVPILAAMLHREPWRPILRTTGWLVMSATVAVAPWFIFVAEQSHRVYRLGTPAWTLLPIGVGLLGFGLACVVASRFDIPAVSTRVGGRLDGPSRTRLVAAITIVWFIGLTLVFARTLTTRGTTLIDVFQIAGYFRTWYPYLVTTAIGAIGLALAVPAMRAADRPVREAYEDLWLATICGLPLVILVIGVGEPPRNYLAQLAIGAGIASGGWLWAVERIVRRRSAASAPSQAATPSAADQRDARVVAPPSLVRLLVICLVVATAVLTVSTQLRQPSTIGQQAVNTVSGWIKDNVEPGSTLAFGSYLGYETALPLRSAYTIRQVRHVGVVGDVDAPEGIRVFGRPVTDDWVSIDIAPRNVNEFQAFSADMLVTQLRKSGAAYWVYSTGPTTSAPTIVSALKTASGFEEVAHWTFTREIGAPIDTTIYRLDLDRLALDTSRIHIAPNALVRLWSLVERKGATDLARRLADRLVPEPSSGATDLVIENMRKFGGS